MKLARNILLLREHHGLTQAEFAETIGLSKQTVSNYETGTRQPSYNILIKTADIFHVSVDWLLGRDTSKDIVPDFKNIAEIKRLAKIEKLKKELAELEGESYVNT